MSGKDGSSWLAAFPHEDAKIAVEALCIVWAELTQVSPQTFNASRKEPELTELLCVHLSAVFKQRTRLTGQWSYERRMAKTQILRNGGMKVVQRKRTDIEYFSDRSQNTLQLVFEFKKLDHTATKRKIYVGEDGMRRFVTGDYSAGQSSALMVGILSCAEAACVVGLVKLLEGKSTRTSLRMKDQPEPAVRQPSAVFPKLARFDTEHERDISLAPAHGIITISHLFLAFS